MSYLDESEVNLVLIFFREEPRLSVKGDRKEEVSTCFMELTIASGASAEPTLVPLGVDATPSSRRARGFSTPLWLAGRSAG